MKRWLILATIASLWLGACDNAGSPTTTAMLDATTRPPPQALPATTPPEPTEGPASPPEGDVAPRERLNATDLGLAVTAGPAAFEFDGSHAAGTTPAWLHSVDAISGEERWSVELPTPNFPFLQAAGDALIYSYTGGEASFVGAVNADGSIRWQATLEWRLHGPFFASNDYLIGTAGPRGNSVYQSAVIALSLDDGQLAWAVPTLWFAENMVAGSDSAVFVAGGQRAIAIDLETGGTLWNQKVGAVIDGPLYADGKLFVGSDLGLFALDATDGTQAWVTDAAGRSIGSPEGVSGGHLVSWLESEAELGFDLAGVGLDSGDIEWIGDSYQQYDVGRDFVVAFGPDPRADQPNRVKIWDGASGRLQANVQTPPGINAFSVAIAQDVVFVGTEAIEDAPGRLIAINVRSGEIAWTTPLAGTVGELHATNDLVIAGTDSGREGGAVFAVDQTSGEVRWSFETQLPIRVRPVILGEEAVFVSAEVILGRF